MFNNKDEKDKTVKEQLTDTLGNIIAKKRSKTLRTFSKRVDIIQSDRLRQIPNIVNKLNNEENNGETN